MKVINPQGLKEILAELNEKKREVTEERVNTELKLSSKANDLLKTLDPAEVDFFESNLIRQKAKRNSDLSLLEQETVPLVQKGHGKISFEERGNRASTKTRESWQTYDLTNFILITMSVFKTDFQGTDVIMIPLTFESKLPNDRKWLSRHFRIPKRTIPRVRKHRLFRGLDIIRNRGGRFEARRLLAKIRKRALARCWRELRGVLSAKDTAAEIRRNLQTFFDTHVSPELSEDFEEASIRSKLKSLNRNQLQVEGQVGDMWLVCREVAAGEERSKEIAAKTRIPVPRVRKLLRMLRNTEDTFFLEKLELIRKFAERSEKIIGFFAAFENLDPALSSTLKNLRDRFIHSFDESEEVSMRTFYGAMKDLGFRFRSVRFERPMKYPPSPTDIRTFLDVFVFLLQSQEDFLVVFVDESSVHPQNFKRRAWRKSGSRGIVRSKVGYEKLMIVGAMTQDELLAVQFLRHGFRSSTFAHFLFRVLKELRTVRNERRTIVVFADNATMHISEETRRTCSYFRSVLLLNLPGYPMLNPIELLWEFLKRPFRTQSSYQKYPHQQKVTLLRTLRPNKTDQNIRHPKLPLQNLPSNSNTLRASLNMILSLIF